MKNKIIEICQNIFGVCLMFAVSFGALVAVLLIIAFIVGGNTAESIALFCKTAMFKCITISAIGSFIGLLSMYIGNSHSLKMDSNEEEK